MVLNIFPVLCSLALTSTACSAHAPKDSFPEGKIAAEWSAFKLPYDLEKATANWPLPDELFETSGLSMADDDKHLLAIQDEMGLLYWIDKQSGAIDKKATFWKEGDYEGVEIADGVIYVVKSSGTIYQIRNAGAADQQLEKFNTFLNSTTADVEGLAYDAAGKRLLIACKAPLDATDSEALQRNIYAFDLATQQMPEKPAFQIHLADVQAYLKAAANEPGTAKIAEYFAKERKEPFAFSPSAIAVHPLTGHIYICSSSGRMLFILDKEGALLHIAQLSKDMLQQPEGLCFDKNGNLYISSEGKKTTAVIVRFPWRP